MATYKVPQDVEAEDKLLGPLTFKQFIFFLVAAGASLMAWLMFKVHPLLVLVPLPVILVFAGLAVFRREDQPMERYLLSFFNYLLRPRKRVWNTEGYYEHLIITERKKPAPTPLKQNVQQVHGQLEKLAQTVDTRGWAAKRPELTLPDKQTQTDTQNDDRLFMPDTPQEPGEVHEREDIMNPDNPEFKELDNLLHEQTLQQREKIMENVRQQAQSTQPPTGEQRSAAQTQQQQSQDQNQQQDQDQGKDRQQDEGQGRQQDQGQQQTTQPPQSDILDMSDELSVSQIAAAANRKSDDEMQEGEEIQLR